MSCQNKTLEFKKTQDEDFSKNNFIGFYAKNHIIYVISLVLAYLMCAYAKSLQNSSSSLKTLRVR